MGTDLQRFTQIALISTLLFTTLQLALAIAIAAIGHSLVRRARPEAVGPFFVAALLIIVGTLVPLVGVPLAGWFLASSSAASSAEWFAMVNGLGELTRVGGWGALLVGIVRLAHVRGPRGDE